MLLAATFGAFSPTRLSTAATPGINVDADMKPKNTSWAEWCGYSDWRGEKASAAEIKAADAAGRDTIYLRRSADVLDLLDHALPRHAPSLWSGGRVLDVGAGSGEMSRYLSRRHAGLAWRLARCVRVCSLACVLLVGMQP